MRTVKWIRKVKLLNRWNCVRKMRGKTNIKRWKFRQNLISAFCLGPYKGSKLTIAITKLIVITEIFPVVYTGHSFRRTCATIASNGGINVALASAQRTQTIAAIRTSNLVWSPQDLKIKISDLIKTSRPETAQPLLVFPYFADRPELCVPSLIRLYLKKQRLFASPTNYLSAHAHLTKKYAHHL